MTNEQRQEIIDKYLRFGSMVWARSHGEDKPRKGVVAMMFRMEDVVVFFEPDGRDSAYRFHKELLAIRKPGDDVWSWLTEPVCPHCGLTTSLESFGVTPLYCPHCHKYVANDDWLPPEHAPIPEPGWTPEIGDIVQIKNNPKYRRLVTGTGQYSIDISGRAVNKEHFRDTYEPAPAKSKHKGENNDT